MKGKSLLLLLIPVLSLAESGATVRRSLKLNLRRAVELATSSEANAHIQTASENEKNDKFILVMQLEISEYDEIVFEWILYEQKTEQF